MAKTYLGGHTIMPEWQLRPVSEMYDIKAYEKKYGSSYADKIFDEELANIEKAIQSLAFEIARFSKLGIDLQDSGQDYSSVFSSHRTEWENINKLAKSIQQRKSDFPKFKKLFK